MSFFTDYCTSLYNHYKNLLGYAETRAKYRASVVYKVHETLVSHNLFDQGIGYAVFSRKLGSGEIAVGVFRLDVFCLGVRRAYANVLDKDIYEERIRKTSKQAELVAIHPACCCKLVEQCVEFSLNLGLAPHKDYDLTRTIFGDVDPRVCPKGFTFGRNGRPVFIPQAGDDPAMCRKIAALLKAVCGPDGYDESRD